MELLRADITIEKESVEAMHEQLAPDADEWFADRGMSIDWDGDDVVGVDPESSDLSGGREVFDELAPFVESGGTVELGAEHAYLVGEFDGSNCEWTEHRPEDADEWFDLGMELDEPAALFCYRRATEIDPAFATAWYNRMMALTRIGRHQQFRILVDRAIEVLEDFGHRKLPSLYNSKAIRAILDDRPREADRALNRAIAYEPGNTMFWFNKACNYSVWDKPERALEALERAAWDNTRWRENAKSDHTLDPLRDRKAFDSIVKHGIRDYERGDKGDIDNRVDEIRRQLDSDDPEQRQRALDRVFELDDRFVYYALLEEGSHFSPETERFVGEGVFEGKDRKVEFVEFLGRLPDDLIPQESFDLYEALVLPGRVFDDDIEWLGSFRNLTGLVIDGGTGATTLESLARRLAELLGPCALQEIAFVDFLDLRRADGIERLEELERIRFDNCQFLENIDALDELEELRELQIFQLSGLETLEPAWNMDGLKRVHASRLEGTYFLPPPDECESVEAVTGDVRTARDSWRILEDWLETYHDDGAEILRPPATDEKIAELEETVGLELPTDFVEFYRVHDGQRDTRKGVLNAGKLLSIEEIIREWQRSKKLKEEGRFDGNMGSVEEMEPGSYDRPDEGIQLDWWNEGWIPFTWSDQVMLHLDLAPTEAGRRGQVIAVMWDMTNRRLEAPSFFRWFDDYLLKLEDGEYVYSDSYTTLAVDSKHA